MHTVEWVIIIVDTDVETIVGCLNVDLETIVMYCRLKISVNI
jgi:hypothetical protein